MTSEKESSAGPTTALEQKKESSSPDEPSGERRPSLNPDAAAFTPKETSPLSERLTMPSTVLPSRRRSMIPDYSRARIRNHSDTVNTQGIPSLLSFMPDYDPSQLSSEEYRRRAHTATGTTSIPPLLMSTTPRTLTLHPAVDANRQRSHSGPDSALSSSPAARNSMDLSGIHSLTRIMVELLRQIRPVLHEEHEEDENHSVSTCNTSPTSQSKYT